MVKVPATMESRARFVSLALAALLACMALPAFARDARRDDGPHAGDVAPAIELGIGLDNAPVHTADYAGRVVVVSFWASWCGPCRKELPMLDALQRVSDDKHLGLQVIAVNIEDRDVFRKIAPKLGQMHAHLVSERQHSSSTYGVHGIPHMVLIDRSGHIAQVHHGYGEQAIDGILDQINVLLAQPAAPTPAS